MPSGNSAAAVLFDRLFRLTGKELWRAAAEDQRALSPAARGSIQRAAAMRSRPMLIGHVARACLRDAG